MLDLLVGVAGLLCALAVMFGWLYYRIPILPAPAVPKRGQTRALGIDIGGVIITHVARSQRESTKEDTSFAESFLKTPPVPGAISYPTDPIEACSLNTVKRRPFEIQV